MTRAGCFGLLCNFGVRAIANGSAFDWAKINLQRLRAA